MPGDDEIPEGAREAADAVLGLATDVHVEPDGPWPEHQRTRVCWCDPTLSFADGVVTVTHIDTENGDS